jgi:hypothetical protein
MSDIVERLRRHDGHLGLLVEEAADEIERLTNALKEMYVTDTGLRAEVERLTQERDSARISNSIETEQHLGFMELCDGLRAQNAEAAAFLDALAENIYPHMADPIPNKQAAADCRAMAAKLREGK